MRVLPILFNSEMVRAILDGRKTVTRRLIKAPAKSHPYFYKLHDNSNGGLSCGKNDNLYAGLYNDKEIFYVDGEKHIDAVHYKAPCKPGDILYVRETWATRCKYRVCPEHTPKQYLRCDFCREITKREYFFKASDEPTIMTVWSPSIHMPKEAARIWLKVTDVRVERLQDISGGELLKEGIDKSLLFDGCVSNAFNAFRDAWDSTLKKSGVDTYGWKSNPWVWVIEFERCENPKTNIGNRINTGFLVMILITR